MPSDKEAFLWHVHEYTNEYIRFADGKAAVVVAWSSAFIGAMFSADMHHNLSPSRFNFPNAALGPTIEGALCLFGFVLLIGAFVSAILAVKPRVSAPGWNSLHRGFIFWESIRAFQSKDALWAALKESAERDELTKHVSDHLFDLGKVAVFKYFWVNLAIISAVVGSAFGVAAMFLSE